MPLLNYVLSLVTRGLIRKILQILFDQRAVFLRILFRLRLLNRRAITFGQTRELARTGRSSPWTIRASRSVPVSFLSLPLAAPFAFSLALPLALTLSLARAGHIRIESRLRQCQRRLRLGQRLGCCSSARLRGWTLPGASLRRSVRQRALSILQS